MSYKYSWTVTSNYHYDATLTQGLLKNELDDMLDSSGRDSHQYYLYNPANLQYWPADREKQHDTSYHEEAETDEPMDPAPTNSTYEYYMNFTMATGINFADLRSSAAAAGLTSHGYIPNGLGLADNTSAGNITFDKNGGLSFEGSNTLANDITFIDGGYVYFQPGPGAGSGNQTLTGLLASRDLDSVFIAKVARGGSVTLSGGQVRRNLRELSIAEEYNGWTPVSSQTGSGVLVDGLVVRGVLNSVYVGSGASVNHLTVGLDRKWFGSDISAFLNESNGVLVPNYWGSHTNMTIASGGTATNITLGNGGTVYVSGLSDTVSSTYNSTTSQWEYTTHYASGTGGILKDLNIASSGGLQFEGITDPRATWNYPSNGYLNSSSYMSGFLATAPQSSYVSFGSNASGSNINIGNGGSLYIDKDAHVSAISMGGLTTSATFVNSSGTTDTWIGDRGASLQIRGGKVSGVVMDPVLQSFDYYSASHDYFWLHSETIKDAYSSAHGSYGSGEAWSSAMYASASATYRQYMSAMYNSGAVYTNLGDDTAYNRRYVGGDIGVAGGWIMNVSGFSYLGVAADVDVTVSNNVSSWKTYQYTYGNVSKAIGAVSATLDVTGGAHVYNVKIEGGRVIMTGAGEVNARWHSRENKQSNYNLVEDLDLRIDDLVGLGSAYPAVIEFFGEGSGGYKKYISSGGTSGYVDYTWDAIDPGEIHSVTASKGLVVSVNWNKQDFTYIGSGAVTINGLGTVVLKDNHSRYSSDSYYGTGPYLGSAFDEYYFGVVKGVYNEEDGVLENYTVLDGADGGFDWTGFLMVGSGGIVQNIGSASPLKTGNDIVNSDTWTPSYTRDECKVLTVVAGGLADNVTVKGAVSNFEHFESQYTESRAGLLVSSGGTATNVTVLEGGIAMAKGGTIDKVFVAAGGVLYLSGWAGAHQVGERDSDYNLQLSGPQYLDTTVLNGVRLDSGGQLTNTLDYGFRKGNAPSVIANKGGGIMNGVTANGVAYVSGLDFAGNITLTKDQQAVDVTVRGYKTITSRDEEGNPTAYNTTIAYMNVSSGGIVNGATVGEEGAIYASNGAVMSGLIASGGQLIFANSSGWSDYFAGSATVSGITIKDGGSLQVNSKFGLTATDVRIEQDAGLEFTLGKTANEDYTPTALNGTWTADWGAGTFRTDDGVLTGFGGQFGHEYRDLFYSSAYVSARLSMTIVEGGVLAGGDLRGYGSVLVKNGGKMLDTKLQGVGASIASSGYASGLSATIASGKNAYGTNIYVYGSGAVADATVLNGGYMGVERGGVVNSVTMLAPDWYEGPAGNDTEVGPVEFEVMAGGTANNVVASAGVITLLDGSKEAGTAGPTLSNADIHSAAMLIVKGDGAVLGGTVNLAGLINTTAKRYEYVEVEVTDPNTGDTYTDWQRVEMNNSVADAATLTVNFDLTELEAPGETAMIDNLANLTDVTLDRISVSADQAGGAYVLAGGSEGYNGSLKVIRDGSFAGTISVGGFLQVTDELTYKLSNTTDEGLVFSVLSTDAAITDIIATSDGKELLKGKWSKYAVNIKTEVNQYSKSIWYRIKQAVKTRKGPAGEEDEWLEFDNEKGLTLSQYCTVELKAKNEKGKDSRIVSYTVNYDATAPEFANLRVDSGAQFLQDGVESQVSVEAWDDLDDAPVVEVRVGDGEWTEAVRGDDGRYGFTVSGNVDFQLRATDHADNVKTLTVGVPTVSNVAADIPTLTNQDVTLTAEFSADSMQRQYSLNGGETWLDYGDDGVVLTENAEVQFRAENIRGQSGIATLTVDYIDKTPPADPVASADVAGVVTDQDVTVTAEFSADSALRQYSFNGKTWYDYTDGVVFEKNGSVQFRATDAAGNESAIVTYTVDNILINGPDKHKNDSLFDANGDLNPNLADDEKPIGAETGAIQLDSSVDYLGGDGAKYSNFVGGDDKSDYAQIALSSAAKLRFSISSYDQTRKGKAKLSLISYDPATGKKKVLKSATSSKNKSAKTAAVYVDPNDAKNAGVKYFLAVENKGNTSVFYNVDLIDSVFYADGDDGWNNGPLLVKDGKNKVPSENIADFPPIEIAESGTQAVLFDTNGIGAVGAPETEDGWNNFVGYGDPDDYAKLSATQPLNLKFTFTATDKVKLVVYKLTQGANGKWSQTTVKSKELALNSKEKKAGLATRTLEVSLARLAGEGDAGYYVSVQSANASKGGKAWYNVSVDSIVYASDYGANDKLFTDKKNKKLNEALMQTTVKAGETKKPVSMENGDVEVGKEVGETTYGSFVGFGDEYDYAEIVFNDGGICTFTVDAWGTAKAGSKFTLYKLTYKSGKWTKKSLGTVSLKNAAGSADGYGSASGGMTVEIERATSDVTRYFVSMQSVDAKKGKEVYYNVTAAMPSAAYGSALAMPDGLSLGQCDTADVLAETCLDSVSDKRFEMSGDGLLASL
jgi:hypothetical protein